MREEANGHPASCVDGAVGSPARIARARSICRLACSPVASSGPVMATAKYGKGSVFAVIDPWLYNEYVSGKHLGCE